MTEDSSQHLDSRDADYRRTVTLVEVLTEAEASIITTALRDAGVDAHCVGGYVSEPRGEGFRSAAQVIVPAEQYHEAKARLEAIRQESREIDWSLVDVGEVDEGEEDRNA